MYSTELQISYSSSVEKLIPLEIFIRTYMLFIFNAFMFPLVVQSMWTLTA